MWKLIDMKIKQLDSLSSFKKAIKYRNLKNVLAKLKTLCTACGFHILNALLIESNFNLIFCFYFVFWLSFFYICFFLLLDRAIGACLENICIGLRPSENKDIL